MDAAALVDELGQGLPRDTEVLLTARDGQSEQIQTLPPYDPARMRRIGHRHRVSLVSQWFST